MPCILEIGRWQDRIGLLEDAKFHSTFTSPPYFRVLDYQHPDQDGLEPDLTAYLENLGELYREVYRVTIPGGCLLVNIKDKHNNLSYIRTRLAETKGNKPGSIRNRLEKGYREKELLPVTDLLVDTIRASGWLLRDRWVWVKGQAVDSPEPGRPSKSDRPVASHEYVLYFRKPTGKGRYREAYWDGATVPSSVMAYPTASSPDHPCPFPLDMAKDLILATCPVGGWVLDPMAGTGTVLQAAEMTGRNALGFDIQDYSKKVACTC